MALFRQPTAPQAARTDSVQPADSEHRNIGRCRSGSGNRAPGL
jgi:hypothetical protein